MSARSPRVRLVAAALLATFILVACSSGDGTDTASPAAGTTPGDGDCTPPETPVISFAAYSTPREVYGKIIPAFQSMWKEQNNDQNVIFQESYGGSTTQVANVLAGYEADVVALSLGPDVDQIVDAGLITHDWEAGHDGGMVATSVVMLNVRPGNPLGIDDWDDLTADGVGVLTPDPASSGGARWNLVSVWGSALRGYGGVQEGDEAGAQALVEGIVGNVLAFDKSARDSIKNFEAGNGDVAITYENEVLTAQEAGQANDGVYLPSSVLIENPVAVVDANVDKHCVREVAEAFVEFLHTPEVKELYRTVGFLRPTDIDEAKKADPEVGFPEIEDLWDVDELGGWAELNDRLFADSRIATQAIAG